MYLYGHEINRIQMEGRWISFYSNNSCLGEVKFYFEPEYDIDDQIRIIDYSSNFVDEDELDEEEVEDMYQDLKDIIYDNEHIFVKIIEKCIKTKCDLKIVSSDFNTFYTVSKDGVARKKFIKIEGK